MTMKTNTLILGTIALLLVSVPSVSSQDLRYLGRDAQDVRKGWIEMERQYYNVVVGTVISGWGTVTEVTDTHIITEYALTEAEKEELHRQGAAAYDVIRIKIPHESLRIGGAAVR
jgi:hypothetical protein